MYYHLIKSIASTVLIFTATAFASDYSSDSTSKYLKYQESIGFGVIFEKTLIKDIEIDYRIAGQNFNVESENLPFMGIAAHLPFKNWIGLNGVAGFQRFTFDYKTKDSTLADSIMTDDFFNDYSKTDFDGSTYSNNLIVQIGLELAIPLYTNYESQAMVKILGFGAGLIGKTLHKNTSKFENANIWGYAYGGGIRFVKNIFGLTVGARSSMVKWESDIEPEYQYKPDGSNNYDEDSEGFDVEYHTLFNPYIKITISFI